MHQSEPANLKTEAPPQVGRAGAIHTGRAPAQCGNRNAKLFNYSVFAALRLPQSVSEPTLQAARHGVRNKLWARPPFLV
jgi:hypothetical protein